MATSGSSSPQAGAATVLLFAGRPDPAWPLDAPAVARLERSWSALAPYAGAPPQAPALGYRGCSVRAGTRTWHAYRGVVVAVVDGIEERRADPQCTFERAVLATAPTGAVPAAALPPAIC